VERAATTMGFVPHIDLPQLPGIVGLLVKYPQTGGPLSSLAEALLRGPSSLSAADRETIAAYVSARNECAFCAGTHCAVARHLNAAQDYLSGAESLRRPTGRSLTDRGYATGGPADVDRMSDGRRDGTGGQSSGRDTGHGQPSNQPDDRDTGTSRPSNQAGSSDTGHGQPSDQPDDRDTGTSRPIDQAGSRYTDSRPDVQMGGGDTGDRGPSGEGADGPQRVDDVIANGERADVGPKLQALLAIAEKVRIDGRSVTAADVARAREAGADDKAIHDTVLIAAAFCMLNRYVDGLATVALDQPEDYMQHAKPLAAGGYLQGPPPRS
jgi:AhpD family alkylhydroperoxidase